LIFDERNSFISVTGTMKQKTFYILRDDSTDPLEVVVTPIAALTSKYSDNPMTKEKAAEVGEAWFLRSIELSTSSNLAERPPGCRPHPTTSRHHPIPS